MIMRGAWLRLYKIVVFSNESCTFSTGDGNRLWTLRPVTKRKPFESKMFWYWQTPRSVHEMKDFIPHSSFYATCFIYVLSSEETVMKYYYAMLSYIL